ncbi:MULTISPECIES: serine hydrolase domain-containing protein [Rhizobium]|uniref:serine hydrolase domain-containing protein n=1 Tax=Rhizobium TaxID=379 RepID=UPI001616FD52|nr:MULTISPECIES: serine hydrolase [Rhizobium]MBB6305579.1 hypothetical protein [Rhizobium leucaenae]MDK4743627.1 serine hydrolase [Rhizobium sp. CNPSo 3464]
MGSIELGGQLFLDGRASDPRELGLMNGAPSVAEKCVTYESDTFLDFPQIRWSLSHMRELRPTLNVRRGGSVSSPLEYEDMSETIDALTFTDMNGRVRTFADALFDTYTDGFLVLRRGRIIYERYFGALQRHLPHACHSITKSYAGTLAASFVHEGVLDDQNTILSYLPELRGTAWEDATLRQVMDMRTGLNYSEEYSDSDASVWKYARASGWRPRSGNYDGPKTIYDYLKTITKNGAHGKALAYKTVNTEVMTWVLERVTGRAFADLLHERLWAPLGCEEDGYILTDAAGTAIAGAGLSATLRDMARFGELMRREGAWGGKQLIPASVVQDVQQHTDLTRSVNADEYRSMWWGAPKEMGGFLAAGIHGQRLYVLPDHELLIARFASHPIASASASEPIIAPQMVALTRLLRE